MNAAGGEILCNYLLVTGRREEMLSAKEKEVCRYLGPKWMASRVFYCRYKMPKDQEKLSKANTNAISAGDSRRRRGKVVCKRSYSHRGELGPKWMVSPTSNFQSKQKIATNLASDKWHSTVRFNNFEFSATTGALQFKAQKLMLSTLWNSFHSTWLDAALQWGAPTFDNAYLTEET